MESEVISISLLLEYMETNTVLEIKCVTENRIVSKCNNNVHKGLQECHLMSGLYFGWDVCSPDHWAPVIFAEMKCL